LRWLFISLLCGLVALSSWPLEALAGRYTDRYDSEISKAAERWWTPYPEGHWLWLKAQLYQESQLDPSAVSPVGAAGLGQFMPRTWDEVSGQLGFGRVSPHSVRHSIMAAAYYMRKLRNGWSAPRPEMDRMDLARASYNAGMGNLLKAQRAAGGANRYAAIIEALPLVTGHHAEETITYNRRIHRWHRELACFPR